MSDSDKAACVSTLLDVNLAKGNLAEWLPIANLEPRLSVPDFVTQLWRKPDFSPKLGDKICNGKSGFDVSDFSPKLRDKIRDGKPGLKLSHCQIKFSVKFYNYSVVYVLKSYT